MSKTAQGTVSKVGKSKYSYFVMLDGENFYYNTKFEPKCNEGDEVKILFEQKAENRGNIKKLKVVSKGTGPAPQKTYGGGGGTDNRQDSIVWQHSQEMAIRYVDAMLAAEVIPLKGDFDAKETFIRSLVDEATVRFFNAAMDPRKSPAYEDTKKVEDTVKDAGDDWGDDDSGSGDDGWDDEWTD